MSYRFSPRALLRGLAYPVLVYLFFLTVRYMLGYAPSGYVLRDAASGVAIAVLVHFYLKRAGLMLYLGLWLVLALLYGAVGLSYGVVDANAVAALINTNPAEAKEFFALLPRAVPVFYALSLLLAAALVWFSRQGRIDYLARRPWAVGAIAALIAINGASLVRATVKHNWGLHMVRINEVVIARDALRAWQGAKYAAPEESIFNRTVHWQVRPLNEAEIREVAGRAACRTCVFVMGESVRRDFMQHYGGPWQNTPWMSSQPSIRWTDFISASFATVPSLSLELYAPAGEGRAMAGDNIMSLAKLAGYETAWLSNQHRRGKDDSVISLAAGFADTVWFTEEHPSVARDDTSLLEPLAELVKPDGKRRFIVLHLWGSHPVACNRTDGAYHEYFMSQELSCYIESLRRTDALLARVADLLAKQSGGDWSLIYTADHGLGFMKTSEGWALKHRTDTVDIFRVPFVMVGSRIEQSADVHAARSGRYLSLMLAEWLGVKAVGPVAAPDCAWLSDAPCADQRRVRGPSGSLVEVEHFREESLSQFIHAQEP